MNRNGSMWRFAVGIAAVAAVAVSGAALAACGGSGSSGASGGAPSANTIVGAGASFPAPIYTKWGADYNGVAGVKLNYQSIGSGGGIAAIEAKTVQFGASDAPLAEADLQSSGLAQFPMVMGGVVPVVNLTGVSADQMKLTAAVLAGIYMGKITTWNDPAIKSLNPGLSLPASKINVVHRSDGSGTTWIFTHYLTAAAPSVWTVGADKDVNWPVGVGGKGNEGVAASVKQLSGSIGYVEYAYAKQTAMTTAQLQNKAGAWVKASLATFTAAADHADWQASLPSMAILLVDQPGAQSWPITGATFILVQKAQGDATTAQQMLAYFDWCYKSGGAGAKSLDYVPIPASAYKLVETKVWNGVTVSGTPVWQQ
jgi:phosphate transport system substrate-binding protein